MRPFGRWNMKHNYHAQFDNVLIRPLRRSDIEYLRIWRNDKSKTKYLRPIPYITPEMQAQWFEAVQQDLDELVFAVEETENLKRLVGSVALYHFQGKTAEVGKIQIGDSEASGKGIGRIAMSLAVWLGIAQLGLHTLQAYVHRENVAAYTSYMRMGFQVVGSRECSFGGAEDALEIHAAELQRTGVLSGKVLLKVL